MYFVYILQSLDSNHFYIGASRDVRKRLREHNNGSSKSTKPYRPWDIIYTEKFNSKEEAMKREYYLKTPKGYLEKKRIFDKNKKSYGEVA